MPAQTRGGGRGGRVAQVAQGRGGAPEVQNGDAVQEGQGQDGGETPEPHGGRGGCGGRGGRSAQAARGGHGGFGPSDIPIPLPPPPDHDQNGNGILNDVAYVLNNLHFTQAIINQITQIEGITLLNSFFNSTCERCRQGLCKNGCS